MLRRLVTGRAHAWVAASLLVLHGCAPPPATTPPQAATEPSKPDESMPVPVEERVWSALAAGNARLAWEQFDDTLRAALPEEKLAAVWQGLVAQMGEFASAKFSHLQAQGDREVRVVRLSFDKGALNLVATVDPASDRLAGIRFKPAPAEAGAEGPSASASYVHPDTFRSEDVSLGSAPFVLSGTLTLPNGDAPFAAVVLVHGSGPHDRDETIGANRPFADIAEGLSSRGVAALRYDKRTLQHRERLAGGVGIDEEVVDDAVAAIALLRSRPEIDPERIYVVGHSLGAQLAPEIALRSGSVAGAVLLAPPGRLPWQIVLAQMRYLGVPDQKLQEIERAGALLEDESVTEGSLLGAPFSYWLDWASRDGVATSKKLARPLLILRGSRDYQVTEDDVAVWQRGLEGQRGVEIATIEGANHLFIPGEGKPGPAEYQKPGHVDAGVLERILRFVQASAR